MLLLDIKKPLIILTVFYALKTLNLPIKLTKRITRIDST